MMPYAYRKDQWRKDGVMSAQHRQERGYPRRQSVRYNDAEREDIYRAWLAGHPFLYIAHNCERKLVAVYGEWQHIMREKGLLGPTKSAYILRVRRTEKRNAKAVAALHSMQSQIEQVLEALNGN